MYWLIRLLKPRKRRVLGGLKLSNNKEIKQLLGL